MLRSHTACALLVGLIGAGGAAGAAGRPDLVESALSVSQHGRSLEVRELVRNVGGRDAAGSRTAYFLAGRRIGSRAVGPLRRGALSRGSKILSIPSLVPSGSWRLRACADAGGRVRETNERNNCRVAASRVLVGDVTPPRFTGLERATTCIPGPVGGTTRSSAYSLQWRSATDEVTPESEIVYEVYEAHTAGGEDFSKPSYTTPPGATSFATPPLPDDVSHYFVVRAVDKAGNRDRNTVERLGTNLCV